jgi:hypothetical protein
MADDRCCLARFYFERQIAEDFLAWTTWIRKIDVAFFAVIKFVKEIEEEGARLTRPKGLTNKRGLTLAGKVTN